MGETVRCEYCSKPGLLFSKKKRTDQQRKNFKRYTNDFIFHCGGSFKEITDFKDAYIKDIVFVRENLDCKSMIELPYYSVGVYKNICINCGSSDIIAGPSNVYPKCITCADLPDVKRKGSAIQESDLKGKNRKISD